MPRPMTYLQIADDIAARIAAGEYRPGDKLPSYRGITYGMPGRGIFVSE